MRRVFVDPAAPQRDALQEAAKWIRNGGLVALPTDTLYGLAADPFRADAVARIFAVKGRDAGRGIPLIAADRAQIANHLGVLPPIGERLAERFWPGPLTIVMPASDAVAQALRGPSGGVGLRCSSDAWARALVAAFGAPITSTSANASGSAPARSAAEARASFADAASVYVLDGGERRGSDVSTVVEFLKDRATLRRPGAVSAQQLASVVALSEEPRG